MSISQLSHLIVLPEPDLQQVLDYASTLSKAEAAEHFKNLLGDSPQAFQFVSDFNSRRLEPKSTAAAPKTSQPTEINAVPKPQRAPKKKKAPLGAPAPRKVESFGPALGTVYNKKDHEGEYIAGRSVSSTPSNAASSSAFPAPSSISSTPPPRQPPSAAGSLVSDLLAVH